MATAFAAAAAWPPEEGAPPAALAATMAWKRSRLPPELSSKRAAAKVAARGCARGS
jgi:hypothetical protein